MATRLLRSETFLPLPQEQVFEFFGDACNLERITPAALRFEIVPPVPDTIREGTLMDYRLRLNGIPFRWRSLISVWDPPHAFVDQMVEGPYSYWRHLHRFRSVAGGTLCEDQVLWRLPLEPLGGLAAPLVRAQLRKIFSYREDAMREALGVPRARGQAPATIEFSTA